MNECLTILVGRSRVSAAVVRAEGGQWRLGQYDARDVAVEAASPELVARIIRDLRQAMHLRRGARVAVALTGLLFSWRMLSAPRVRRRFRFRALAAAFEDRSLHPIEDLHLVAGTPDGDDSRALVVAADKRWLDSFLAEMEVLRVYPDLLVPDTAVLAQLAWAGTVGKSKNGDPRLAVVTDGAAAHTLYMDHGVLLGWNTYAGIEEAKADTGRWALSLGQAQQPELSILEVSDRQMLPVLGEMAADGQSRFNVCQGALGSGRSVRRSLRHASTVLVLLAAILAVTAVPRSRRAAWSGEASQRIAAAERQVWQTLVPDEPAPASVQMRLESDLARLRALAGESPDAPSYRSARGVLEGVLASLPLGVRLDVAEMRFDQRDLTMRGETNTHSDAERIARAIDSIPGLSCGLPRSDVLAPGRITFVIHASLIDDKESP